jgi:hypothetical protein
MGDEGAWIVACSTYGEDDSRLKAGHGDGQAFAETVEIPPRNGMNARSVFIVVGVFRHVASELVDSILNRGVKCKF